MDKQTTPTTSQDLSTHSNATGDPQPASKKPLVLVIGILLAFLVLISGYLLLNQFKPRNKIASINSFEECKKAGYPVLQSLPEQCGVPGGQLFFGPTENSMQPTSATNPTTNWKTYVSDLGGYQYSYPPDWKLEPVFGGGISSVSPSNKQYDFERFYISNAATADSCDAHVKETLSFNWETSKKYGIKIDSSEGTVIEGKIDFSYNIGINDRRVIFDRRMIFIERGTICYELDLTSFNNPSTQDTYDQILQTFKFTGQKAPSSTTTLDTKHSGVGVIEFANIEQGSGAQLVGVKSVGTFAVTNQTKIYDENNKQVEFSHLRKDQKVNISGRAGEGYLEAIEIKVQK